MKQLKSIGLSDRRAVRGAASTPELFRPGYYSWVPHTGNRSTGTNTVGRLELCPRWFGRAIAIDKLAFETTVVSSAGGVVRLGIYANSKKEDFPDALLWESSTIAVDSGTGLKESATLGPKVFPPGLYWIGLVAQTASPTFRVSNAAVPIALPTSGAPGTGGTDIAYAKTSTTGALPDPFTSTSQLSGATACVGILVGT